MQIPAATLDQTLSVRRNVIAGYAGSVWTGLMSLVFIPVYVAMMGIEAYGLVGFFLTLQSVFAVLDLGLSTTLNREFALLSAVPAAQERQRTVLRTIEIVYWLVALLNAGIVIALARPIARSWVQADNLPLAVVAQTVIMMGLVLFFQWPLNMYSGGLLGLQRQVTLNIINAAMATLRAAGAIVAMWLLAPTLQVFFGWQMVASAIHTAVTGVALRRYIGGAKGARFELSVLKSVRGFAAGIVAIGAIGTLLIQADKLVVSRLLSLTDLGYYTIAAAAAMSLYRIISPFFAALFPRFSQLVAAGDDRGLAKLYHRSCEVLSVIVLPVAIFLAFFSREVLLLWTRDSVVADKGHVIMSIQVIGTAMSGLMTLPYAVQLAYGWTRLTLTFSIVALLLLIPGAYVLTMFWHGVGASVAWLAYNTAGVLVVPLLMHRRLLRGEQARFYLVDIGYPLLGAVLVAGSVRALLPDAATLSMAQLVLLLGFAAVAVQLGAATAAAGTRAWIASLVLSART